MTTFGRHSLRERVVVWTVRTGDDVAWRKPAHHTNRDGLLTGRLVHRTGYLAATRSSDSSDSSNSRIRSIISNHRSARSGPTPERSISRRSRARRDCPLCGHGSVLVHSGSFLGGRRRGLGRRRERDQQSRRLGSVDRPMVCVQGGVEHHLHADLTALAGYDARPDTRPTVSKLVCPIATMPVKRSTPKLPRLDSVDARSGAEVLLVEPAGPGTIDRVPASAGELGGRLCQNIADDRDDDAVRRSRPPDRDRPGSPLPSTATRQRHQHQVGQRGRRLQCLVAQLLELEP